MPFRNSGIWKYVSTSVFAVFIVSAVIAGIYFLLPPLFEEDAAPVVVDVSKEFDTSFIKAVSPTADTALRLIRVSAADAIPDDSIDGHAGRNIRRIFNGRRINIAVIGVDSRLGERFKHADANHVISILIDSGKMEITAIPRDTPADAGLPDSSDQNKLTVVRGLKGRTAYLKEAARIAELDKIHYYIELGFSQAMGILEWLGFSDSGSALQMLRSRRGLGGGDYQRAYNQSQFIRQMILCHFDKFTGLFGEVLIRGGLALVETNLSAKQAKYIISRLKRKRFASATGDITLRVRPAMPLKYKVYDFTDPVVVSHLEQQIERFNNCDSSKKASRRTHYSDSVAALLARELTAAESDSADHPTLVISRLRTYFDQRAWLQICDSAKRYNIRKKFRNLLINAYIRKGWNNRVIEVRRAIEAEENLFDHSLESLPVSDSVNLTDTIILRH